MINRKFRDGGIHPFPAYLLLSVAFIGFSIVLFQKTIFAVPVYVLAALSFIANLSEIKRSDFLRLCFGDLRSKKIRLVENLIGILPFVVFLLFKKELIGISVLLVSAAIIAVLNISATVNFVIPTPFSKRPFEFIVGFRNTYYLIFIAYLLSGISVYAGNFNLGVFSLLLIYFLCLSFYTKPENEYYVWNYSSAPGEFLILKIKLAFLHSTILVIPVILLLGICFYTEILTLMTFWILGFAFLVFMILSKYSSYPRDPYIVQGILMALSLWFPPLLLVLIPYLFRRSEVSLGKILKSKK